jgi:hypothetical protein
MMTETNSDDTSTAVVDDKPVNEDDLRAAKYGADGVDEPKAQDEPPAADEAAKEDDQATEGESDDQIEADAEEAEEQSEATFTKKFPNIKGDTPEEYAQNLEVAYENSTAEFQKLRKQAPPLNEDKDIEAELPSSMLELYAKQELDKKLNESWQTFSGQYSQVNDPVEYDKFKKRVATVNQAIISDERRLAEPSELYAIAASSLGWKSDTVPSDKESLAMAVKDNASTAKSSGSPKPAPKASKVSSKEIAFYRKLHPGDDKTDAQIREELEPHH